MAPAQGRGFLAEDAREGQDKKVVLGHALWQRSFGGEPMLGRSVIIDAQPYVVVGIAPPGFQFPDGTEVWAPLVLPDAATARRDQHYLSVDGKARAGPHAAGREGRARASSPSASSASTRRPTPRAASACPRFRSGFGDPVLPQILVIWQAAAVLVLLIACVNVANLILAQAAERGREMALRIALGAGPGRVARQLLTEGAIVALVSAALAMPLDGRSPRA